MTKAQAIEHFGSISKLAKALGISYEAIRQWEEVPELRQYQIERLTKGKLARSADNAALAS
ncbi:TPA: Cro/CI family transcriptional regulator [Pseudomonas aeruginosa]